MKFLKRVTITGVILCMALFSSAAAASAATSQAWAYFEWDSFEYNYTGTGSWVEQSSQSNASAAYGATAPNDSDDQNGWTATEAFAETRGSWGWGETDTMEADMNFQDIYAGSGATDGGYGAGNAGRFALFSAQTSGTLTLSMDYHLGIEGSASANEKAIAEAGAYLSIGKNQSDNDILSYIWTDDSGFPEYETLGTLSVSYALSQGELAEFSSFVATETQASPVPVPAGIWLLAPGFAAVIGIRRNRDNNQSKG
jgi:hypothetical protein